jgi:hypothetical protein
MEILQSSRPFGGITPKKNSLVKLAFLHLLLAPTLALCKEELPKIRAKAYDASFVRKSRSTRVYLFDETVAASAKEGKIILMKEMAGDQKADPLMAFRILKTYPEKNQFAAKKVKHYGKFRNLIKGEMVHIIEKISDLDAPPLTPQDNKDLKELENTFAPPPENPAPDMMPAPEMAPPAPAPDESLDQMLQMPDPISEPQSQNAAPNAPGSDVEALPEIAPATDSEVDKILAQGEAQKIDTETAPLPMDEGPLPESSSIEGSDQAIPDLTPIEEPSTTDTAQNFDQDLDSQAAPTDEKKDFAATENEFAGTIIDDDEEVGERGITVEEIPTIDPYRHWFSFSFGSLKNIGSQGTPVFYTGAGLKYGLNIAKHIFFSSYTTQDSLTLEGGAFLYKVLSYNLDTPNDSYTVAPFSGILRYNISLGETFGIFLYGGMVKNLVIGAVYSDPEDEIFILNQRNLASLFPTFGGGLLFHLGPNWDTRVDVGLDQMGVGLSLRF